MRRIAASVAISLLGALFPAGPASASSLYLVNLNDGSVSQYGVGAGGALSPLSPAVVPAGPGLSEGIAITPDGRSAYVANLSGSVSQYDIGPGRALTPKNPASVSTPSGATAVAISPDGKSVYVGDKGSNLVSQFDVGPGGVLVPKAPATVPNAGHPDVIAVSPDGRSVYVGDGGDKKVSQYDVGAGGVLTPKSPATVPAGGESPEGMAVSPDGKSVYVANYGGGVSQFDIGPGGLLAPKSPASVAAGEHPTGIGISPDGKSAYVANDTDNFVSQYDVGPGGSLTPKTPPTLLSGLGPDWVAVSPSGHSVYFSIFGTGSAGGGVAQFDTGAGGALLTRSAFLTAGNGPISVAITPDLAPAASLTVPAGRIRPGVPIAMSASASSDPDGSIARYDWSFGDGQSAPNGGAAPMHAFANPGRYTVTVTVTDNEGCSTALVFTGQTALCSGSPSASQTQPVDVTYPAVRVRCPAKARPKGCKFKLRAVTKRRKGKAESAVARSRAKAGHTTVVPLKPKAKFRSNLATAGSVLVKETVTIDGSGKTSYRKLKIVG
jgi:DNA-binding beta-propeller fold protein YncE